MCTKRSRMRSSRSTNRYCSPHTTRATVSRSSLLHRVASRRLRGGRPPPRRVRLVLPPQVTPRENQSAHCRRVSRGTQSMAHSRRRCGADADDRHHLFLGNLHSAFAGRFPVGSDRDDLGVCDRQFLVGSHRRRDWRLLAGQGRPSDGSNGWRDPLGLRQCTRWSWNRGLRRALAVRSYGIIGGIGAGMAYITPMSMVTKWFPDRKGLAGGLVAGAFGSRAFLYNQVVPRLAGFHAAAEHAARFHRRESRRQGRRHEVRSGGADSAQNLSPRMTLAP